MTNSANAPGGYQAQAPLRGILWMVVAAFFFSVSVGIVRHLSDHINAFEQTFWRQLIGLLIIAPFMWRVGASKLKTKQFKANVIRNLAGYAGISLSFYSVTLIPLADSLALQFTLPLFTIIIAMILLNEQVGKHRWIATCVGFAGALIILRPGFAEINLGMMMALGAAASFALSDAMVRKLSLTDSTALIVFYGYVMQVPFAIPLAVYDWVTPNFNEMLWLVALGLVSFAAQWSLSKAFVLAEASLVSPVLFLRLPFVSVIGYFFFAQSPDIWTWAGALLIFAGSLYAARREAYHQRAKANS